MKKTKIVFNYTLGVNRNKTQKYLKRLEREGKWLVRQGQPISPREAFDLKVPPTNVFAMPVLPVSSVIEHALRKVEDAQVALKGIACRSTLNIGD